MSPGADMIRDAAHVVHVLMSEEDISSVHAALGAATSVKDYVGRWEDDASLLQRDEDSLSAFKVWSKVQCTGT